MLEGILKSSGEPVNSLLGFGFIACEAGIAAASLPRTSLEDAAQLPFATQSAAYQIAASREDRTSSLIAIKNIIEKTEAEAHRMVFNTEGADDGIVTAYAVPKV